MQGGKNKKFDKKDKKDGVEFKMMFRHHKDPLYYDTNASAKIFVPMASMEEMTDEQRAIVDSLPAEDRGEILDDDEYAKKGYGLQDGTGQAGHFVEG